jgi:hypothetical protein
MPTKWKVLDSWKIQPWADLDCEVEEWRRVEKVKSIDWDHKSARSGWKACTLEGMGDGES